jgi:hypothetical protein
MPATYPGLPLPLAEFTAHCPEIAKTRSTAAHALEPPVRPTLQRKLQRQGRATKSRAAWRLPRLTLPRRERAASAMTPRRLWVDQGGSAAGPEPGAASFTLELGGLAAQELVIGQHARAHTSLCSRTRQNPEARLCEAAHSSPDAFSVSAPRADHRRPYDAAHTATFSAQNRLTRGGCAMRSYSSSALETPSRPHRVRSGTC